VRGALDRIKRFWKWLVRWWKAPQTEPLYSFGLAALIYSLLAPIAIGLAAHRNKAAAIGVGLQLEALIIGVPTILLDRIERLHERRSVTWRLKLSHALRWPLRQSRLFFSASLLLWLFPLAVIIIVGHLDLYKRWMGTSLGFCWLGAVICAGTLYLTHPASSP
jgi:hypothetical protein